jgi:hypothetical protein
MRLKNFLWVYSGIRCAGYGVIPSLYGAMWQFFVWNPVDLRAEDSAALLKGMKND